MSVPRFVVDDSAQPKLKRDRRPQQSSIQSNNKLDYLALANSVSSVFDPTTVFNPLTRLMSPPLLPTNSAYPYPPLPQSSTPGDPKSEDDWLDHQPLIDDPSPTPTTPTPYQHRNSPHSLSLNGWRRVWLTLALALVGLVGLDLARTTATPKTKLVYSNAVDQSALAKHFGYNPDEKVVVLYGKHRLCAALRRLRRRVPANDS